MKTREEIVAEIERWKQFVREKRHVRDHIEAGAAAIIVGALAWALGEMTSPTTRVKIT